MSGIFDTQTPLWSNPEARELREVLAAAYWQPQPVIELCETVGIRRSRLPLQSTAHELWGRVFEITRGAGVLDDLFQEVLRDSTKAEYHLRIRELLDDKPVLTAPSPQDTAERPEKPWVGFDDRQQLERIIADSSTLLDISFLRRGVEVGSAVARVTATLSTGRVHGTAFRIGPQLLLTNHHVLFDWDDNDTPATTVGLWFGYEKTFAGRTLAHSEAIGDTTTIEGDKNNDWAVIACREPLDDLYAILPLDPEATVAVGDRVYIIQHPSGQPKQIGLHHNLVRHVDDDVIQYWTDTAAGSSGSPVFNDRWQVVALHHRWLEMGRDGRREYRNQGRRVRRVVKELRDHGLAA